MVVPSDCGREFGASDTGSGVVGTTCALRGVEGKRGVVIALYVGTRRKAIRQSLKVRWQMWGAGVLPRTIRRACSGNTRIRCGRGHTCKFIYERRWQSAIVHSAITMLGGKGETMVHRR